jgi:putative SOS response-associated peptidase YedK
MCGRYAFFDPKDFANRYLVDEKSLDFSANYNISPGSNIPVVTKNSPHAVHLMKWGLIPHWSKEFKMNFKTFNARLENLKSSRLFSPLLKNKRCLIPANGFYEWSEDNGKQPHFITTKDQKMFSFAGLYDIWTNVENKKFYTFTIITTSANKLMSKIHHRMPVILKKEAESQWIDNHHTNIPSVLNLLDQYDNLSEHPVSKQVNLASNNSKDLIKPL